jgi:hypothetical protein
VFTPCKNHGVTDVCKHGDYATIMKAVYTPCCSEPREVEDRAMPSHTAPCPFRMQRHCKHGDDATVLFIATFLVRSDSKLHDKNSRPTESVLRSQFSKWVPGASSRDLWLNNIQKNAGGLPVKM